MTPNRLRKAMESLTFRRRSAGSLKSPAEAFPVAVVEGQKVGRAPLRRASTINFLMADATVAPFVACAVSRQRFGYLSVFSLSSAPWLCSSVCRHRPQPADASAVQP